MRPWLRDYRTNSGYTVCAVAKKIGISKSYYEKIESGDRNVPVKTAKKIAAVLDFPWQKFF